MSIFNLFKKKEKLPTIIDKVWMKQVGKEQACVQMSKENPQLTFVAWSSLTQEHFRELLNRKHQLSVEVVLVSDTLVSRMKERAIVFLEHHIDRQKELDLLKSWHVEETIFLNTFDDPIFHFFHGDRMLAILERMGMGEDDVVEHQMISQAIVNAQKKIEKKGLPADLSISVKEWLASMR